MASPLLRREAPQMITLLSLIVVPQEARRGAELDARGVRAEELRLRDLAVSLDGRAEEIRRRERESARSHEDALQAARHEARQAVAGKEESVARER